MEERFKKTNRLYVLIKILNIRRLAFFQNMGYDTEETSGGAGEMYKIFLVEDDEFSSEE